MLSALAQAFRNSPKCVALTGAGISTDCGIPDFRGDHGRWQDIDPMDVASIEGFEADTGRFYRFWAEKFAAITTASPGVTHRLLAQLEQADLLKAVVTQNIDGLHQKAGSECVYEAHGSFRRATCLSCGHIEEIEPIFARVQSAGDGRAPACRKCRGRRLKPGVVLFGEMLPESFAKAEYITKHAGLVVALGSSLQVHPFAGLLEKAKVRGATVAIINREKTPYDGLADFVIRGELSEVVPALEAELGL